MRCARRILSLLITFTLLFTFIGCNETKEEQLYKGNLDASIDIIIKNRGNESVAGEFIATSYKTLGIEKIENCMYTYLIYSAYGFEKQESILRKISECAEVPVIIVFEIHKEGTNEEYYALKSLSEYTEEDDIYRIFPSKLWQDGFASKKYKGELEEKIILQAEEYAKEENYTVDIGR